MVTDITASVREKKSIILLKFLMMQPHFDEVILYEKKLIRLGFLKKKFEEA